MENQVMIRYILISLCVLLISSVFNCSACPLGDISGDCFVGFDDLLLLSESWMSPIDISVNLDDIGNINLGDFAIISKNWLKDSPVITAACDLPVIMGSYYTDSDKVLLYGTTDPAETGAVRVGGYLADLSPENDTWNYGQIINGNYITLIQEDSIWKYWDKGTDLQTAWRDPDFVDADWDSAKAQLGYGDNGEVSEISYGTDSNNKYITYYFRRHFQVDDKTEYKSLLANLVRDDGAVVYLNGYEEFRDNMQDGEVLFSTEADQTIGGSDETAWQDDRTLDISHLRNGDNVLAVEVHQINNTSSDLSFNFRLFAELNDPDQPETLTLNPGKNRIPVQAYSDPEGLTDEIARTHIEIVYDDQASAVISGTLTENTVLDAASSPWHVTGTITIPEGITLTIEPGTVLFFYSSAGITVHGQILADGSEQDHIAMIPKPGNSRWQGLRFEDTLAENVLSYVDMDYGDGQGDSILIDHARVYINHITFTSTNNSTALMELTHPYAVIRYAVFPPISGREPLHGNGLSGDEYLIFDNCTFGSTTGYNDIIDFTGGKRPGPIIQMYNNFFPGGGDDALDFDDTDGHVEGNVFLAFVGGYDGNADHTTSNAVATDFGSDVVIARNLFIGGDHHVLLKNDVSIKAQNNTFIGATMASINFGEPGRGVDPGAGAYLENNIFLDNTGIFFNIFDNPEYPGYGPDPMPSIFNTLVPSQWHYLGENNIDDDPLFTDPAESDYSLQPGSPAIGTGTNGLDMGYLVPAGASVSGGPVGTSDSTEATFSIGGPGITHYKYRLVDNGTEGPWSDEIALPITGAGFPASPENILGTLQLTGLKDGHTYRVEVIGKNSAGLWQGRQFRNTDFFAPGDPNGASSDAWTVDLSGGM